MVLEALIALSEVSFDFTKMIVDGCPKKLLHKAIRHMRAKKLRREVVKSIDPIIFTKPMIEDFFGVSLKDLKVLVSNYI